MKSACLNPVVELEQLCKKIEDYARGISNSGGSRDFYMGLRPVLMNLFNRRVSSPVGTADNSAVALLRECYESQRDDVEDVLGEDLFRRVENFLQQPCPSGQPTSSGTANAQIAECIDMLEWATKDGSYSETCFEVIDKLRQLRTA